MSPAFRLQKIKNQIKIFKKDITVVVITKSRTLNDFETILASGHLHFGENKVQEAIKKWSDIKRKSSKINLHLVGTLQRNKVKDAVRLFDYVHSLDSIRLAESLKSEEVKQSKKLRYFIQVNIGEEIQKGGIKITELSNLINYCKSEPQLDIQGLMCIPPEQASPQDFFKKLKGLNDQHSFSDLSMGMSNDYSVAIANGSTFVRIGSAIFNDN